MLFIKFVIVCIKRHKKFLFQALRTPPPVLGLNHKEDFIVTIGQFWLDDYWKDFELSNLTLFYKFEVKVCFFPFLLKASHSNRQYHNHLIFHKYCVEKSDIIFSPQNIVMKLAKLLLLMIHQLHYTFALHPSPLK